MWVRVRIRINPKGLHLKRSSQLCVCVCQILRWEFCGCGTSHVPLHWTASNWKRMDFMPYMSSTHPWPRKVKLFWTFNWNTLLLISATRVHWSVLKWFVIQICSFKSLRHQSLSWISFLTQCCQGQYLQSLSATLKVFLVTHLFWHTSVKLNFFFTFPFLPSSSEFLFSQ